MMSPLTSSSSKRFWAATGYVAMGADNGRDGCRLAREKQPKLILLDIMMSLNSRSISIAILWQISPDMISAPAF
ncbi:MAG: hypothetical protein ABFS09_12385 [Thermodesulfobacteriota bacterium]